MVSSKRNRQDQQRLRRVLIHHRILREIRGTPPILWIYVTHLRQKIEADSTQPRLIKTESGIGYRFESSEA
jgi:two-component system, OmpR family, KDP operon response regulator KdpE